MYPYPYNMSSKQRNVKLRPEQKLKAIERIRNGETKASVARSINVPESTLRGWVKTAEKIRFTVDRILFTKRTKTESHKGANGVKRSHEQKQKSVKSTSPSGGMELNAPQHHRPWVNTKPSTSKNGGNQFGSKTPPLLSPLSNIQSNFPISTTPPVLSKAPEYKHLEQSLFLFPTKNQSVIKRKADLSPTANDVPLDLRLPERLSIPPDPEVSPVGTSAGSLLNSNNNDNKGMAEISPTARASNVSLNLRLPEGLTTSPNPVVSPIGTSGGNVLNLNTNNNKTPEDLSICPNAVVPRVSTSRSVLNLNDNNNNTNDRNNNNPIVSQCTESIIDALQALWYAERFSDWFETYSDPTITVQDFIKFQELLGRVKKIAAARRRKMIKK